MGLRLWEPHQCISTGGQPGECGHELCRNRVSFPGGGVCRHWVIVHWTFTTFIQWSDAEQLLADCLSHKPFRFWGSRRATGERIDFRLLVQVDPEGPGLTKEDLQVLELEDRHQYFFHTDRKRTRNYQPNVREGGRDIEWESTEVISFRCCAEFLRKTWPGWLLSIQRQGGTRSGDASLLDELHDLIIERAVAWSENDEGLAVEQRSVVVVHV